MTSKKINPYLIFIGLIILLNLDFFYLYTDFLPVDLDDITIFVELLFLLFVYFKNNRFEIKDYKFFIFFIFAVLLVLSSSIASYFSYSQPIILGILPQRHWIVALAMYFPIVKLIDNGKITKISVIKLINKINIIFFIILVIQLILSDSVIFLNCKTNDRYDSIRLYINTTFFLISYFYYLNQAVESYKISFKSLFFIFMGIFVQLFIYKSRMEFLAVTFSSFLLIIVKKFSLKKLIIIIISIILLIILINTSIGEDTYSSIFSEVTSDSTSSIREIGRAFYFSSNTESIFSFVFGSGFINTTWETACELGGINDSIFYNDNGIFGLFFYYGFAGVIWIFLLYFSAMKLAFKNKVSNMFFYLLVGLLGMYSLIPSCYSYYIGFAIVLGLIEGKEHFKKVIRNNTNILD